jgi:hypothetical protein
MFPTLHTKYKLIVIIFLTTCQDHTCGGIEEISSVVYIKWEINLIIGPRNSFLYDQLCPIRKYVPNLLDPIE